VGAILLALRLQRYVNTRVLRGLVFRSAAVHGMGICERPQSRETKWHKASEVFDHMSQALVTDVWQKKERRSVERRSMRFD